MIEKSLKSLLQQRFDPIYLDVENESARHHGHAGSPGTGQSHFKVTIVCAEFDGMTRVQRHQAVNAEVVSLFDKGLHALSLKLLSSSEYNRN